MFIRIFFFCSLRSDWEVMRNVMNNDYMMLLKNICAQSALVRLKKKNPLKAAGCSLVNCNYSNCSCIAEWWCRCQIKSISNMTDIDRLKETQQFIWAGIFSRIALKSHGNNREIDDAILCVATWRAPPYKSE